MTKKFTFAIFLVLFGSVFLVKYANAQKVGPQPPVESISSPKTPLSQGFHNGLGLNLLINNFGFGAGVQYRHVLAPMSEMTLDFHITGLRNVSEQTFYDIFGQQIIPDKYNRVLAFPLMIGYKHRLFARAITDNFRIYAGASVGPSLAFIYPYFKDYNQNHIRDNGTYAPYEPINGTFTDWKDGHFKWGGAGKLVLGIDFGSKFKHFTGVEFGYYMQYFPQGIQVLQPNKYVQQNGQLYIAPGASPQKYFGTPLISLIFGHMW